jgi:hypothetical protein
MINVKRMASKPTDIKMMRTERRLSSFGLFSIRPGLIFGYCKGKEKKNEPEPQISQPTGFKFFTEE